MAARVHLGKKGAEPLVEARHIHLWHPLLLAEAAEERLGAGMRMDVDQARHDEKAASVDDLVGHPVVTLPDKLDPIAPEGEITAAEVGVTLFRRVPGDDPIRALDAGGLHHFGASRGM